MMEDFQGAGLGWDHPFVQCRMKVVLKALRSRTPLPQSFCADLAPDPEILSPQSPLASVRFTPVDEDYAEEYYVPENYKRSNLRYAIQPIKKSTSNPEVLPDYFPLKQHHAPTLEELQQHHLQKQIIKELESEHEMKQRMRDIQEKIENRRIMEKLEAAAEKAAKQRMDDYIDNQAMDYDFDRRFSKEDTKRTFFRVS
jgi:receptor-type tyrosine-protein phosphatase N